MRGFRAVYLGLFFNCFIMGMVMLAACKIANILFGLPPWQTIVICGVLNVVFAAHAGLWGVLVIDMIQFFIKMTAVIAAAYFALKEVARRTGVGDGALAGLQQARRDARHTAGHLRRRAASRCCRRSTDAGSRSSTSCRTSRCGDLALMIFIMPIADRLVGQLVSGRRAGRRQLHRPAHARVEVGEGLARRHAVLQPRALRAAAVAVDHHRALLDHRLSRAEGHSGGVSGRRSAA